MATADRHRRHRGAALVAGAVAAAATAIVMAPGTPAPATANNDPAAMRIVSSDPLPTVQINGVAWSQAVVGTTVYVGGNFTTARPAGTAPGQQTVARTHLLAYDITTGSLITSFAPTVNAQVRAVAASPDGTRLYIAGDFTLVNGQSRARVAAFDVATGQLVADFAPPVAYNAHALAVTNTTVYVGGNFNAVGNQVRKQLAAFQASDGALLDWAPEAVGGVVRAIALSPDATKLAVGGQFTTLNGSGSPGYGLGMVDAVTGAALPFDANLSSIRSGGNNAGVTSLHSDGTQVYATAFVFGGGGNFEGVLSAEWDGGEVTWIADCHGDHYSVTTLDDAVYAVGHAHFCGNLGGFPQTPTWTYHYGVAFTTEVTGPLATEPHGQTDFAGQPGPSALPWYPPFTPGTFTGTFNGPWTLTANGDYLLAGGEFTAVAHQPQQGLVRFAVRDVAPNDRGPQLFGSSWAPRVVSLASGEVRITWGGNVDDDDDTFTYRVERAGAESAIHTTTGTSVFFHRGALGYTDRDLVPGSTQSYRVVAVDPWGNEAPSNWVSITVADDGVDDYPETVFADQPTHYWRMGGTDQTVEDLTSAWPLELQGDYVTGAAGAISGDPDTAVEFVDGSSVTVGSGYVLGPHTFSVEAWVRTTSTTGGVVAGFGTAFVGPSPSIDRVLYLSPDGTPTFGVRRGPDHATASGATALNDGEWHHLVGTLGDGTMRLYVDGVLVDDAPMLYADVAAGVWRIGGDSAAAWPDPPAGSSFVGTVDEVAVYHHVLAATSVAAHHAAGIGAPPPPPTTTTSTTSTTTTTTTTTLPAPQPFAVDTFTRSVPLGLGTADIGGAWVLGGPASSFSVDGAAGRFTMTGPANGASAMLPATAASSEARLAFRVDSAATGGGIFVSLVTRKVGVADYRAKVRLLAGGGVQLILNRAQGAEVVLDALTVPGLSVQPGTVLRIRAQAGGSSPTTLRAKVWRDGDPEPTTWQVSAVDGSAVLQAAGTVGVVTYLSGSAVNAPVTAIVDDLWAGPPV